MVKGGLGVTSIPLGTLNIYTYFPQHSEGGGNNGRLGHHAIAAGHETAIEGRNRQPQRAPRYTQVSIFAMSLSEIHTRELVTVGCWTFPKSSS